MKTVRHIGIIMDGNGRWAQLRDKPRTFGHIKGARVAKKIITACSQMGIHQLTLYAFSSENWLRPPAEVQFLMHLLRRYLKREAQNLVKENIQFRAIGEIDRLPSDLALAIKHVTQETAHCSGLKLTFAISYGSRQEITQAVRLLAQKVQDGKLTPYQITEDLIGSSLFTDPSCDPDLIIRTSGEQRLSNFLLWQAAYSEFCFTDTLWPDFSKEELVSMLTDYGSRERRFGKTTAQISNDQLIN